MGQALYRNYRPKKFADVIGQEPITDTLSKAIKSGRISHAYLLTGPRGVGKTSVARILAHEVNDLPYTDENIHLDIIEIDAASNRRIDEIRDIREKVHMAPTSAKYKVYIIDEAHMLTKEAFNALLKTLEEPPAHCIFILATTEAHKLPETIISRTQRYNFKPVSSDKTAIHLSQIAIKEKIDIEPAALELLAEHGSGSFRDSISMLDQLSGTGHLITEREVSELIGLPPQAAVDDLIQNINAGSLRDVLDLLGKLRTDGVNPAAITSRLSQVIRKGIISGENYSWGTALLKDLLDVSASRDPFELLEISVLSAAQSAGGGSTKPPEQPVGSVAAKMPGENLPPKVLKPKQKEPEPPVKISGKFSLDIWPDVISRVKQRAASLYTALRLADPTMDGDTLRLEFQFPLHRNKVNEAKQTMLISDIIEELSGAKIEVRCELAAKKTKLTPAVSTNSQPKIEKLAAINSIFGKTELLES